MEFIDLTTGTCRTISRSQAKDFILLKMTIVLNTAQPGEPTAAASTWLALLLPLRRHLTIVHLVRGRVRLRLSMAGVRAAPAGLFERLQKEVASVPAIRSFRVNAAALSVTIEFDPDSIPAEWWSSLLRADDEEAGYLLAEISSVAAGHARHDRG